MDYFSIFSGQKKSKFDGKSPILVENPNRGKQILVVVVLNAVNQFKLIKHYIRK